MYVYLQSEPGLWTVGFYKPSGEWVAESDHDSPDAAAERVHWLNGGAPTEQFIGTEHPNQNPLQYRVLYGS